MKIFCLIGCSAAGKDTIYNMFIKRGFLPMVSDTTRPMREGETQGKEYNFITKGEFLEKERNGEYIEFRRYDTEHGIWYYGLPSTCVDREDSKALYMGIFDYNGFRDIQKHFGEELVEAIYIDCPLEERLERSFDREPNATIEQKIEMLRRQMSDMKEIEVHADYFWENHFVLTTDCSTKTLEYKIDRLMECSLFCN